MTPTIRASIKRLLAAAMRCAGLLRLIAALRLRNRAVVLMYHRILPPELQLHSFSATAMFVTPQTFERHIRFLSRKFNPVTLERFIELLESGRPFPLRTCLITFDDGWRDNLEHALPILLRHRVPAALFVTTSTLDSGTGFWQEHVTHLLVAAWQAGELDAELVSELGVHAGDFRGADVAQVRMAARAVVTRLKEGPRHVVDELVRRITDDLRKRGIEFVDADVDTLMSWDEVRRIRDSGIISIGSHGESHTPLTRLQPDAVRDELAGSRACLQRHLGDPIIAFAYPNGDHDPPSCLLARETGYRVAFTTLRGAVAAGDDPHRLRRVSIHENAASTPSLLMGRLVGLF